MRIVDLDRLELWYEKEYSSQGIVPGAPVVLQMCDDIVCDATSYWESHMPLVPPLDDPDYQEWECHSCHYISLEKHCYCPECGCDMLNGVHSKNISYIR